MIIKKNKLSIQFTKKIKIAYSTHYADHENLYFIDDHDSIEVGAEFIGEEPKFLIQLQVDFFHLLTDTLGVILDEFDNDPNMIFIIDSYFFNETNKRLHVEKNEILKMIHNAGVRYMVVDSLNKIRINNFYFLNSRELQEYPALTKYSNVRDIAAKTFPESVKKATKNLYVSRRDYSGPRSHRWEHMPKDPGILFENDNRMDDELLLEEYFKSLGYDVVYSSDNHSIRDGMEMFSSAKRIVSITGAALSNCVFMNPGSMVIEISVPMGMLFDDGGWHFALHNHYKGISDLLDHTHMSISTMRSARDLINKIENNADLKNILEIK